jgi:Tfp pilus assembly protein FimT
MELLLVAAIITLVSAVGLPIYISLQNSNGLDVTVNTLVQDLYQAQILSRSEQDGTSWGVAIAGQTIDFYAGSSYATRNTAYDNIFTMPVTIVTTGPSEIDFSKLYGLPTTTGTFTLTSAKITRTVVINAVGMVDYQ